MLFNWLRRIESRRELVLVVLRVYLGAGLLVRGIGLVGLDMQIQQLLEGTSTGLPLASIAIYVVAAHVIGGALMLVGLYTRLAALIQVPILVGAVFLVHWQDGLLSANQSLEFSALVLYLLLIVCVFGGGPFSLDRRWWGDTPEPSAQPAA